MNPIPLVTAHELRPLVALLTGEDRALIERWCETCHRWTESGTQTAPVMTVDVRMLLQATVRLCRECLQHESAAKARAAMATLSDSGEGGP